MSKKGLYIQMFSIHGLLRSDNLELGHDADTGGQIKYVIELCNALSAHKDVRKIDLFTRLISDKSCSDDYSRPVEAVNEKFRIVRIQCGGKKYIRKELLWSFLDEFVDKTIKFIRTQEDLPDVIHGHYPDAGYVAKELARFFGAPFIYTGHSLGRSKKKRLLDEKMDIQDLNRRLKIDHRINTEEKILKVANLVVTSTNQEIMEQYGQYKNRTLTRYEVIPPGISIDRFYPFYDDSFESREEREEAHFAKESIRSELNRFFQHKDRPVILTLCRPDRRKNIEGLVKAYGEDPELQAMANLAVFAGIRKDISMKADPEKDVLTRMLLLMDKYNLYGKMAIPKKHDFKHEVPELYRMVAGKRGVFVNPALTEPFGITLLEALATGVPIVATNDGGPQDIIENCKSGTLIDPKDTRAIASAVKEIIVNTDKWNQFSKNGIINTRKYYTWKNHVSVYVDKIISICQTHEDSKSSLTSSKQSVGQRMAQLDFMLITDIDNTLLGGKPEDLKALLEILETNRKYVGFGVATGRVFDSALDVLKKNGIRMPDIIISSVGSQISYGTSLYHDKGWETHITKSWNRDLIISRLKSINFIKMQSNDVQRPFKISYNMQPGKDRLARINHVLTQNRCQYTLIYSHGKYLDILPYRASKGKAVRYLSYKWGIPLKNFIICGDSGNDEEMLKGEPLGVIVGNYSPELEHLKQRKNIFFAKKIYAGGILQGLEHYRFIQIAKGLV